MSTAPTLNVELTLRDRLSPAKSMNFDDLDAELKVEQATQEADNIEELRPAEGPGSRLPAPETFAHTGESKCIRFVGWDDLT